MRERGPPAERDPADLLAFGDVPDPAGDLVGRRPRRLVEVDDAELEQVGGVALRREPALAHGQKSYSTPSMGTRPSSPEGSYPSTVVTMTSRTASGESRAVFSARS